MCSWEFGWEENCLFHLVFWDTTSIVHWLEAIWKGNENYEKPTLQQPNMAMQFPFLGGKYVIEWSILRCYVSSLAGMYIKPSKKSTALENFLLEYAEHLTGVCILFSESNFFAWKNSFKKQKKQPATVGIVLPSIHHVLHLGNFHNHWTIESLFKFDKPNLSPFWR